MVVVEGYPNTSNGNRGLVSNTSNGNRGLVSNTLRVPPDTVLLKT